MESDDAARPQEDSNNNIPLLPEQDDVRESRHEYQLPLSNQKRRLSLLLRSLWGRGFTLKELPDARQPQLRHGVLCLPAHICCSDDAHGIALYRAMALHMAAHLTYTQNWSHRDTDFTPMQQYLIEMVEDARVEQNIIHYYPGFKKLWSYFITASSTRPITHSIEPLLKQITQTLLNKNSKIDDEEISAWTTRFHQSIIFNRNNSSLSVQLGIELHNILAARKALHGIELKKLPRLPYRDGGFFLWGEGSRA